ncbi:MAG: GIY-YIG nuclease family protein [Turneriella sp.]
MKPFGKKITLFLIDGEPNGRVAAEISNWTGKAYKIPRTLVKTSRDREDLDSTGIYLLFGKDTEDLDKDMVYVGEAESIYERLLEQLKKKEFWNECICIFSKDENLNKAHAKYLEGRIYGDVKSYDRFTIENSTIPAKAALSEADAAEMEEFLEHAKLIVHLLGYRLFDPSSPSDTSDSAAEHFFIKTARNADAEGYLSDEGFVVCKDSAATPDTTPSLQTRNIGYFNLRQELIRTGILVQQNDKFIFSRDYTFSSPSAAATTVMGTSANGRTEWKTKTGMTLEDYEAS